MIICNDLSNFHSEKRSIVTLGKFDGIHRGHRKLFEYMRRHKRPDEQIVAFTFDFCIRSVLSGKKALYLFDINEKRELLRAQGVDVLIECPFDDFVRTMDPVRFIEYFLVEKLNVKKIVIGDDFRFGFNRAGDASLLSELSTKYAYEFYRIEKEKDGGEEISATLIRNKLSEGNIERVNELLGFNYFVSGKVLHGNHLGADIGSPTINQRPDDEKLLPPFGVYFSLCNIKGVDYPAISNIGVKPTVGDDNHVGVETFLLNYSGDLYDEDVVTKLYHYRRPEMKFSSVDELKETIAKDSDAARKYWKEALVDT